MYIYILYIYIYIYIYIIYLEENCRTTNNLDKALNNKLILLEHQYKYQKTTL